MSHLEPFAEKLYAADNAISPVNYRVGYRLSATQAVLAQIEIPAPIVEHAVLGKLLVVPRITPDGTVTADISMQNDLTMDPQMKVAMMPIDQLVLRGTESESLRLEEARASELQELLGLLERSVSAVRTAMATLAGKP
ncbi:hypothetical protein CI1B_00540 [Bradyrhizobium ivorense]|uniref:Uncharacterized protein n=1 Tax=Bradyrhizobium ivorense TaxID=2511166 RepID=A0A508SSL6_9BRAD|nr:hypothetical protein [Bradyrhizobium ivorense]VIO64960.1 hypothetical protein CI1B_00540 [Bradyrhizobium ivorense]